MLRALGERGAPHDDESYGGTDESLVNLDYFRSKVREFQVCMQSLDMSYQAGLAAYSLSPSDRLRELLDEYQSRAGELVATAEAINAGAALVNSMGGRMPVLSIPSTLGLPPMLLPAAAVAALGAVAFYVGWAGGYMSAMTDAIAEVQQSDAPADVKAAITAQLMQAREAHRVGTSTRLLGVLAGVPSVTKWLVLGVGIFALWQLPKLLK